MALIHVELHKCPHCQELVEVRLVGISSRLGPAHRVCRRCGQAFPSDRREWPEMTAAARWRYWMWSWGYILVGGMVGGGALHGGLRVMAVGFRQGWIPTIEFDQSVFWVGFLIWAGVIGVFQTLRIAASIERVAQCDGEPQPAYVPPVVGQFGWHIPFAVFLAAPLIIGWIVALLRQL